MQASSLENSQKLWELSRWDDDALEHFDHHITGGSSAIDNVPKYSLGFLIRKSPPGTVVEKLNDNLYRAINEIFKYSYDADTPENAVALLHVKLFTEGILKREGANDG